MKMYRTNLWKSFNESATIINEIEIDRKTDASVFIEGKRYAMISDFHQFHSTFNEAKKYLVEKAKAKHQSLSDELERVEKFIETVENEFPQSPT